MSIPSVATWQHEGMSLSIGARAWFAYFCLPRDPKTGKPPAPTDLEMSVEPRISRGALGKLFNGFLKSPSAPIAARMAEALMVTPEWLSYGRGSWPTPTGPVPPRKIEYDGPGVRVPVRYEDVTAPASAAHSETVEETARDTLAMAIEAAGRIADVTGDPVEDVWADFYQSFAHYQGEPLTVRSMVRIVSALRRGKLGDEFASGSPIDDEAGPPGAAPGPLVSFTESAAGVEVASLGRAGMVDRKGPGKPKLREKRGERHRSPNERPAARKKSRPIP